MNVLLLSDQTVLQAGLQGALAEVNRNASLFRTSQILKALACLAVPEQRPHVVMIDLGWCGLRSLKSVVQRVMDAARGVPLVVLVDRPDEVSQVRLAGVGADTYLAKTATAAVVRQAMARFDPSVTTVSMM